MKRFIPLTLVFLCLFAVGCGDSAIKPVAQQPGQDQLSPATYAATSLCGSCGQIKGSETCCAADAAKCEKCSLAEGSPGCCKMTAGADAALCTKCGQIEGGDSCCAEDAEKCADCGLAKGSPGCCKMEKVKS